MRTQPHVSPVGSAISQQATRANQQTDDKNINQIAGMIKESSDILLRASTVFPFTLFPDTVSVDRQTVTIAHRTFFGVAEVISMRVGDILNITTNVGPFFGSVRLHTRFYDTKEPYKIPYFWREDALRLKQIISGHIIAAQKKVDLSTLSKEQVYELLYQLGSSDIDQ